MKMVTYWYFFNVLKISVVKSTTANNENQFLHLRESLQKYAKLTLYVMFAYFCQISLKYKYLHIMYIP